MIPRLILFDFDYTLFDASDCLFPALRKGLQAVHKAEPPDGILKALIGISLEQQFAILSGTSDAELYKRFHDAYKKERELTEETGTHPIPGAIDTIKELKKNRLQLGIVSTGAPNRVLRTLAQYDVLSYFGEAGVVGGAHNKKEAIGHALGHFGIGAQDTIYVGDRPDDGAAALDAGVGFLGVTTGAFTKTDFPKESVVLTSVAVLPRHLGFGL
jgi:phosphoglycolate phosphatase